MGTSNMEQKQTENCRLVRGVMWTSCEYILELRVEPTVDVDGVASVIYAE